MEGVMFDKNSRKHITHLNINQKLRFNFDLNAMKL